MNSPSKRLPLLPRTLPLLLGLTALPALAQEEAPQRMGSALTVALDLGASLATLRHPATPLPPTPTGFPRATPERDSVARVTFGVQLSLSQFFNVRDLLGTNVLDWYLSGDLRAFSLRLGLERELELSRWLALGLGVHGAVAEVSIGTGELVTNAPQPPGAPPGAEPLDELRANQWLFGLGGTLSLLVLTGSPAYVRVHAGYTRYLDEAERLDTRGRDYTPEGFSVSLSGPSAGVSLGVRL